MLTIIQNLNHITIYKWPYLSQLQYTGDFPMVCWPWTSPGGPGVREAHPLHARNGRGDPSPAQCRGG